ncbi:MAG: flagellar motor switch protein FliN [Bryobacteraceae bacterium]|jgi:flagellar motor switch protein FliN/FliY
MTGPERTQLAAELAREWTSRLRAAVEMMAQQPLTVTAAPANAEALTRAGELPSLEYSFSHAEGAPLRVSTPNEASAGVAKVVLAASGIEEFDEGLLKETWQEILAQAASGLAQHVGMRSGAPVGCGNATEASGAIPEGVVSSATLSIAGTQFEPLFIAFPWAFLDALAAEHESDGEESGRDTGIVPAEERGHTTLPPTLDLLLDVEMPVSVSFGRTFLPVREVLKLATGSIIELDRPVNQYVEVVVNNCVIARGEVVVIEGNYGVRIHEIISRGDRIALQHLTTLDPYQPTRISA